MAQYGTRNFFGLDSQTAPHLLEDGELTMADNVNYDIHGAVRAERTDLKVSAEGFNQFNGIGTASINGVVYSFFKVFESGEWVVRWFATDTAFPQLLTTASIPWGTGRLRVYQGDNAALLVDGSYMRVWEGPNGLLRALGPLPEPDGHEFSVYTVRLTNSTAVGFSRIYNATAGFHVAWHGDNTLDALDDLGHLYAGVVITPPPWDDISHDEWFYVREDCVYPPMQARHFRVGRYYPDTAEEVDQDTLSRFYINGYRQQAGDGFPSASNGSGGWDWTSGWDPFLYPSACGLTGTYKYAVAYVLKRTGRPDVETGLIRVPFPNGQESGDLTYIKRVEVEIKPITDTDIATYLLDLGALSFGEDEDVQFVARLYRTKADAETFYVAHEWAHDEVYTDSGTLNPTYIEHKRDDELGAVYLQSQTGGGTPPLFADAVVGGNRLYAIDESDRRKLHFSFLGDLDYWNPLSFVSFPERLTGVSSMPGFVAAFSQTRCWLYDNDDGIGYLVEVPVQLGIDSQKAVLSLSSNVYFANDLGLYELSGQRVRRVSDPVEAEWVDSGSNSWAGAALGSKMVWSPGTGKAFVVKLSTDGIKWARTDQPDGQYYQVLAADASRDRLLIQMDEGIYLFGKGADQKTMRVRTKQYGGGVLGVGHKLVMDIEGDVDGYAWVVSNYHEEPEAIRAVAKRGHRHMLTFPLKKMQGEFWTLVYEGTGRINGWWVEVSERDPAH